MKMLMSRKMNLSPSTSNSLREKMLKCKYAAMMKNELNFVYLIWAYAAMIKNNKNS